MRSRFSSYLYASIFTLLICYGIAASSANTTSVQDSKVDTTKVASDPLIVSAVSDPMNRVGHPLFVVTNIKNVSGEQIIIKNIIIKIDDASLDKFKKDVGTCIPPGEPLLSSGQSIEPSCRFEMNDDTSLDFISLQNKLLSAEIRLSVTAKFAGHEEEFHYYPSINVKAPESSIFIGGLLGALLLAGFVLVETMLRNPMRQEWGKNLVRTTLLGLRGGIMAMIALIIGKATQSTGSPISMTVTDFNGGIVVGLFSYPLAAWISSTLKLNGVLVPNKTETQSDEVTISDAEHTDAHATKAENTDRSNEQQSAVKAT